MIDLLYVADAYCGWCYGFSATARIARLTGATFGAQYQAVLAEGSLVMDSDDAAIGLMALRRVAGEDRGVEALSALQAAFYVEGLSLSLPNAYVFAAQRLGVDADAVLAARADEAVRAAAAKEQRFLLAAGIDHFPTVAVATARGLVEIGSPTATPQQIIEQAQQVLA